MAALWWTCAAVQIAISLKSTRTSTDCRSNASENTSIKNWLIQWNRAEPGEADRQAIYCATHSAKPSHTVWIMGSERKWGLITRIFRSRLSDHPEGRSQQTLKILELQILFLTCCDLLQRRIMELFTKGFWQIELYLGLSLLDLNGMCKPGCKALRKCMWIIIFTYTIYMAAQKSHYQTVLWKLPITELEYFLSCWFHLFSLVLDPWLSSLYNVVWWIILNREKSVWKKHYLDT